MPRGVQRERTSPSLGHSGPHGRLPFAQRPPTNYILGPNGDVVTVADLPDPSCVRWVIRRKAEVVLAVHGGLLTLHEACQRYRLTEEEFLAWETAIERHGVPGLRAMQIRENRHGVKPSH